MTAEPGSLRVAIYGTGRTAAELARQLRGTPFKLVAVVVHDPAKAGRDVANWAGVAPSRLFTTSDVDYALGELRPDVLLYAGLGGDVLIETMRRCLRAGADFINATFIHPETALGPSVAVDLGVLAKEAGARALGTGVNPGLWLDVLPALISTACEGRTCVTARRVTDISFWGEEVLRAEVGVGGAIDKPPARFYDALTESALVLAEALGVELDEVERNGSAIQAAAATQVGGVNVNKGAMIGFDLAVRGTIAAERVLEVRWIGMPDPESGGLAPGVDLELVGETGDTVRAHLVPPPDPYPGTAARMLKSIGPLRELPPGLYTPASVQRLSSVGHKSLERGR
jgi:hypothetical protein